MLNILATTALFSLTKQHPAMTLPSRIVQILFMALWNKYLLSSVRRCQPVCVPGCWWTTCTQNNNVPEYDGDRRRRSRRLAVEDDVGRGFLLSFSFPSAWPWWRRAAGRHHHTRAGPLGSGYDGAWNGPSWTTTCSEHCWTGRFKSDKILTEPYSRKDVTLVKHLQEKT